jgi:L-fuconolactonase
LVAAMPDVRFVVDHLAKPAIRSGADSAWDAAVASFRGLPNAWWKLSGLVTEADWHAWQPSDLQPFVDRALEVAGADRLMFGSDWPVCLLAAGYDEVVSTAHMLMAALTADEQAAVFGGTAVQVYGSAVSPS